MPRAEREIIDEILTASGLRDRGVSSAEAITMKAWVVADAQIASGQQCNCAP
jgi:hypothetical protein